MAMLCRSCPVGGCGQSAECPVWWSGGAVGDVTWPVAHAATLEPNSGQNKGFCCSLAVPVASFLKF